MAAIAATAVAILGLAGGGFDLAVRQQFGLALWAGLALLAAFGRLPLARPRPGLRWVAIAAAALLVWTALSGLWAPNVDDWLAELNRLSIHVGVGLLVLGGISSRNWRWCAYGLGGGAAVIVLVALVERLFPELLGIGVGPRGELARLAEPLDYWNALAALAVVAMLGGLALGVFGRDRRGRGLAFAMVPAAGLALHLTYSRGGLVALAVGLVVLATLAPERELLARRGGLALLLCAPAALIVHTQPEIADGTGAEGGWIVLACLCGAMALAYAVGARRRPSARRASEPGIGRPLLAAVAAFATAALLVGVLTADQAATDEATAAGTSVPGADPVERLASLSSPRSRLWRSAGEAAIESTLVGKGAGSFRTWWITDGGDPPTADAHSLYLETAAELGLPGLVALLVALGVLVRGALRSRRRLGGRRDLGLHAALLAVFAALAAHAALDWIAEVPLLASLAIAAVCLANAAGSAALRPTRTLSVRRVFAVAAAVAMALLQVPGLVAADRIASSSAALLRGDDQLARERAEAARTAAPWSAAADAQLARVELADGRDRAALVAALSAQEAAPEDWRYALLVGAAGARTDRELAGLAYERAARLRPAEREFYLLLAGRARAGQDLPPAG